MLYCYCNHYKFEVITINLTTEAVFTKNKISASYARVMIYEHLASIDSHPTVDAIYKHLHQELPTLSKTTVYNTLALFIKNDLVHALNVGNNEKRYDLKINQHIHFYCTICKGIYDIASTDNLVKTHPIPGFKIIEKEIVLKGICRRCNSVEE